MQVGPVRSRVWRTGTPAGVMRVATVPHEHACLDAVLPADVIRTGPASPAGDPPLLSPWLDNRYLRKHAAKAAMAPRGRGNRASGVSTQT
jgi:hypothetical protein